MSIRNELLEGILSATTGGFNPTTDINLERLFDGVSDTLTQEPAGTGTANAIQIDFGPAFGTGASPVSLLSDGTVNINQAGTYRAKVSLQFGRTGASGTSLLLFRVRVNGAQAGRTIAAKISNSNDEQYFENDTWLTVPAGAELRFDIMRDSSGNDSGGLFGVLPSADVNVWNDAPSAAIRIERWV